MSPAVSAPLSCIFLLAQTRPGHALTLDLDPIAYHGPYFLVLSPPSTETSQRRRDSLGRVRLNAMFPFLASLRGLRQKADAPGTRTWVLHARCTLLSEPCFRLGQYRRLRLSHVPCGGTTTADGPDNTTSILCDPAPGFHKPWRRLAQPRRTTPRCKVHVGLAVLE